MILSKETVDLIEEFITNWQAKEFNDADQLVSVLEELAMAVQTDSEKDYVLIPAEGDG